MMYCYNCGKEVQDVNFCPCCGVALNHQNTQTVSGYQPLNQQYHDETYSDDAPDFKIALLSFFIPVVGIVLYIIWNKDYPKKAKSALKGLITSIVLSVVVICCMISEVVGFVDDLTFDDDYNYGDVYPDHQFDDFYYNESTFELYE